jgi:hypothetical protein
LADEYQQSAAEHQRQTGEAVPVGNATGDAPPEQIADELFQAIHSSPEKERGQKTLGVIQGHNLTQGAFAQQVGSKYKLRHGVDVTAAINVNVPESGDEGALSKRRLCTQPFLYNEDNLMAGAEASQTHGHEVAPRHVRHLVSLVEQAAGGTWAAQTR